jgi:hypothetical protein
VLNLILVFAVVGAALLGFLWGGTRWFQGYIYSEPVEQVYWRAPAAAAVLLLFLGFWGYVDYRAPGRYVSLFDFSPTENLPHFKELWGEKAGKRTLYKLTREANGAIVYRDDRHRPMPSRLDAVIAKEDSDEVRFEAERDAQGNYKIDRGHDNPRYRDKRGRELSNGQISRFYWGRLLANLFLNLLHLAVWFACLWLLLHYQWPHALGLAVIFWLVMTIVIVPMLLNQVESVARKRAAPPSAAQLPYLPSSLTYR